MEADRVRDIIDRIADGENAEILFESINGKDKKELEYLMPAISKLVRLSSIHPDEGLKEKIKARIMEKVVQDKAGSKGKLLMPRFGLRLRPVAIMAAMMLLGTGTAFASTSAMPDSVLYPLKKAIESVSKNVVSDKSRTLQILEYNQRRIEEIQYLKTINDEKGIGRLVKEINMNIKELKKLSKGITPGDRKHLEDRLTRFVDSNQKLITKQEAKTLKKDSRPEPPAKEIKDKVQDKASTGANDTGKTTDKPAAKIPPQTPAPKVSGSRPVPPAAKPAKPGTPPNPVGPNTGKKGR